jgi:hypothetical protein
MSDRAERIDRGDLDINLRDSIRCLYTVDFEGRIMREIWRTEANNWNLNACRIPGQRDLYRGIVRIYLNRISFSEMRGVKIFESRRISHGLLMKDRFKFDMNRAPSASWRPETCQLIFDLFGKRPGVRSSDFLGPNRIVFFLIEESSSMIIRMIWHASAHIIAARHTVPHNHSDNEMLQDGRDTMYNEIWA